MLPAPMKIPVDVVVSALAAAFNSDDPRARLRHLATAWRADGSYHDPLQRLVGRQALAAHISRLRLRQPGLHFGALGQPVRRTNQLVFDWLLLDPRDRVLLRGLNTALLDEDGRVCRLRAEFSLPHQPTASLDPGRWHDAAAVLARAAASSRPATGRPTTAARPSLGRAG